MTMLNSFLDSGQVLALVFGLLLVICAARNLWRCWHHSPPPGPFGLPVIGYLPFINPDFTKEPPHVTLSKLVKKYGKVFSIQLGQVPCVVIADVDIAKRCFNRKEFSGRAPLHLTHGIMKGFGLICAEGQRWKIQRKFTLDFMQKCGMSKIHSESMMHNAARNESRKKMESKVLNCVHYFLHALRRDSQMLEKDSKWIASKLSHTVGNMMNEILFGMTYKEDSSVFELIQRLREEGIQKMAVAQAANFLPWIQKLDPKIDTIIKDLVDGKDRTHEEYARVIHEMDDRQEPNLASNYVKHRETLEDDLVHFTNEQLYHLVGDLFGAGVDTTITTLKWILVYLATYKDSQETVFEEITSLKPEDNEFGFDLINKAVKTKAILLEIQRLCPAVPLGVPHGTVEQARLEDKWLLPSGTMVMILHWHINRDPEVFENPDDFIPVRFLTKDPKTLIPFQVGRRRCIGEDFGNAMVFTFVANLISRYEIELTAPYDFNVEPETGFTRSPNPFSLKFIDRKSAKEIG